jgi:hypothetical protein
LIQLVQREFISRGNPTSQPEETADPSSYSNPLPAITTSTVAGKGYSRKRYVTRGGALILPKDRRLPILALVDIRVHTPSHPTAACKQ